VRIPSIFGQHFSKNLAFCTITLSNAVGLIGSFAVPFVPSVAHASSNIVADFSEIDVETARIYRKALQTQSDGDTKEAQNLYEQVVQVQPNFIAGWGNLGNVLVSEGNLEQGLLCYRKAISLKPEKNMLWILFLNEASVELSLGRSADAIRHLDLAERIGGTQPVIFTTKAVALSNEGKWPEACTLFENVISSGDRDAFPWWLRYSMSLLETGRGMEAIAYLQRTLNRFVDETECLAFATSLYTYMGNKQEAGRYWKKLSIENRQKYNSVDYVSNNLKWGPKAVESYRSFLSSKYATMEVDAPVAIPSQNTL